MKLLETARLVIRRMQVDDAGFMLELLNDPSFLANIGDRGVRSLDEARNFILQGPIANVARFGFGFDVVECKASGQAMGFCGLAKRDYLDDIDIGYAFLPRYCGQGYAFEAAQAVRDDAATRLGLRRLLATTRPDNHSSAKLLEKLGLRRTGQIRHPEDGRVLSLFAMDFTPT